MENFNLKSFLAEGVLLKEEALNFSPEEIELLKDGLSSIIEYSEGVAPDGYIDAVRKLEAKLG